MAGHLIGAAGALSALSCVLAIRDSVVPGTINLTDLDPECALPNLPTSTLRRPVNAAIANGLAFRWAECLGSLSLSFVTLFPFGWMSLA